MCKPVKTVSPSRQLSLPSESDQFQHLVHGVAESKTFAK